MVSLLHGPTWLVDSLENNNFAETSWELCGQTSEISSFRHCWMKEARIWPLIDQKRGPNPAYFWHACKFCGVCKRNKISVDHDNWSWKRSFHSDASLPRRWNKASPYVVLMRKTLPKDLVLPRGIHVCAQAKGWMDESLEKDWLNSVWSKVGGLLQKRNLLVWDSFRAHLSDNVEWVLKNSCTDVAVIPGGIWQVFYNL